MDNVPKETHAVSVMTQRPLVTVAVVRDQNYDRLLPLPIRRQRRLTVEKATRRKVVTRGVRLFVEIKKCKNPSCRFWHLPVCVKITCLKRMHIMAINAVSDMLSQKV